MTQWKLSEIESGKRPSRNRDACRGSHTFRGFHGAIGSHKCSGFHGQRGSHSLHGFH